MSYTPHPASTSTSHTEAPLKGAGGLGLGITQAVTSEEDKWMNEIASVRVDYEAQLKGLQTRIDTLSAASEVSVSVSDRGRDGSIEGSHTGGDRAVTAQNVRESEAFVLEVAKEVEVRSAAYRAANPPSSSAITPADPARISALQDESDASRRRAVDAEHRVEMLQGDIATLRAQLTAQVHYINGVMGVMELLSPLFVSQLYTTPPL